jgi:hypothetical protein
MEAGLRDSVCRSVSGKILIQRVRALKFEKKIKLARRLPNILFRTRRPLCPSFSIPKYSRQAFSCGHTS